MLFLCVGCDQNEKIAGITNESEGEAESREPLTQWGIDYLYVPFENLLGNITDIVKAKYLGTIDNNPNYIHEFEVQEVVKGVCEKTTIVVWSTPMNISFGWYDIDNPPPVTGYDTKNIEYEMGKEYLLLLKRQCNVYIVGDMLQFIDDSICIPIGHNGLPDIEKSTMYNTEFKLHVTDNDLITDIENEQFLENILESTKNNPTIFGDISVKNAEIDYALNNAEYVLEIQIESVSYDYYVSYYRNCVCNVKYVFKGKLEEEQLHVKLPTSKAEEGQKYYVALKNEQSGFSLVTQNSVWNCS